MKFNYQDKQFDIVGISDEDHIYRQITRNMTFYEIDLLEYMAFILPKSPLSNRTAIDIGANIGNHSIYMRTFLADYLIAVEPNPKVLPVLHRNLDTNIRDYQIVEFGLGNQDGEASISIPESGENNIGMAKVSLDSKQGDSIKITTLDSIISKWESDQKAPAEITLIKIDVEGMELPALQGASNVLAKHRPHIFAEAATTDEYRKLNNYLKPLGYRTISKWAATPVYHFAHSPSLSLYLRAKIYKALKPLRKLLRSA
ncbi:MAG: FkbM family methyltransferase [Gammaproteobacteria bacterium]|nr:FkbM family methyltransferase [Gammaproteobacteria bacterium]